MIAESLLCENKNWWKELNQNDYYTVLSNDMDSLLSCRALSNLFGIQVGGYFSFEKGLFLDKEVTKNKEPLFIDCCIMQGKGFDNHFSEVVNINKELFSLNRNVKVYNEKYNGSTVMLIYALYRDILPSGVMQDEDVLNMLLAIDSGYKGAYNAKYAYINYDWWNRIGIPEFEEIIRNRDINFFIDLTKKKRYDRIFNIDDKNRIITNYGERMFKHLKLELVQSITKQAMCNYSFLSYLKENMEDVFCAASTYSKGYMVSIKN